MLFDGRLVETVKHTHRGTSFTKQFEILFRGAQPVYGDGRLKSTKALLMQRET